MLPIICITDVVFGKKPKTFLDCLPVAVVSHEQFVVTQLATNRSTERTETTCFICSLNYLQINAYKMSRCCLENKFTICGMCTLYI